MEAEGAFDFTARAPHELSFKAGERLFVLAEPGQQHPGWVMACKCTAAGEADENSKGLVPENHIKKIEASSACGASAPPEAAPALASGGGATPRRVRSTGHALRERPRNPSRAWRSMASAGKLPRRRRSRSLKAARSRSASHPR